MSSTWLGQVTDYKGMQRTDWFRLIKTNLGVGDKSSECLIFMNKSIIVRKGDGWCVANRVDDKE